MSQLEFFFGTGGVGKSTISTSRALHLASQNKNVLLLTIDPAKRLKEILEIEIQDGVVAQHSTYKNLNILLMSPFETLKRATGSNSLDKNRILSILTQPYAGMNEIFSLIEIDLQMSSNKYDFIVVDTPPGEHFLDFLHSAKKINSFFNKSFLDLFQHINSGNKTTGLFKKVMNSGIDKVLSGLNKVTGEGFVHEFVETIALLNEHKAIFIEALKLEQIIKSDKTNCFMVISADHKKNQESKALFQSGTSILKNSSLVINRDLSETLSNWSPKSDELKHIKNVLQKKSEEAKKQWSPLFQKTYIFNEISSNIEDQLATLTKRWTTYES